MNDYKNIAKIPLNTIILGRVEDLKEIGDIYQLTVNKNLNQYIVHVLKESTILIGNEVEVINPYVLQKDAQFGSEILIKGDIIGKLAEKHEFSDTDKLEKFKKTTNVAINGLAVGYHKLFSEVVEFGDKELFHPHYETEDKYIGIYGQPSGMAKMNVEVFKKDCEPITYSEAYKILKMKGYEHLEIIRWLGED